MKQERFWKIDNHRYLQNDADIQNIQPEFIEVVKAVSHAYLIHLSPVLHSCYLTGSISRGMALRGISDLDSFAVLKEGISADLYQGWVHETRSNLLKDHSEVLDIQMEIWEWRDLFEHPLHRLNEFQAILKLNSLCLLGEDLSSKIPPIKADVPLANTEVIQLKSDVEEVL